MKHFVNLGTLSDMIPNLRAVVCMPLDLSAYSAFTAVRENLVNNKNVSTCVVRCAELVKWITTSSSRHALPRAISTPNCVHSVYGIQDGSSKISWCPVLQLPLLAVHHGKVWTVVQPTSLLRAHARMVTRAQLLANRVYVHRIYKETRGRSLSPCIRTYLVDKGIHAIHTYQCLTDSSNKVVNTPKKIRQLPINETYYIR